MKQIYSKIRGLVNKLTFQYRDPRLLNRTFFSLMRVRSWHFERTRLGRSRGIVAVHCIELSKAGVIEMLKLLILYIRSLDYMSTTSVSLG